MHKKSMALLISLLYSTFALAALPPRYQNQKDLEVMVAFIEQHPRVAATLDSIDMRRLVIYFNTTCKAVFGRVYIERPPRWVGPAAPLEFKHSNCPVDYGQ